MGPGVEMPRPSADEALSRLIEGNQRFVRGAARREPFRTETLAALSSAQRPYATILGCSDSRVPPEWVFDAGVGELFVIRVAGNVLSPEVAGSLQYAGRTCKPRCSWSSATRGAGPSARPWRRSTTASSFGPGSNCCSQSVVPGLPDFDAGLPPEEQLSRAVESNVRWTVRQILESAEGKARVAEGWMKIVGAVYELETGRVRFLSTDGNA